MPFLQVDGLRTHYQVRGEGPDVLLIHGWTSSWRMWERTMQRLSDAGFRAWALDLIGFGDSDKPYPGWYSIPAYGALIGDFCQVARISSPFIVGHSMGSSIALELALQQDADVQGLILVSPIVTGELGFSLRPFLLSSLGRRLFDLSQRLPPLATVGELSKFGSLRFVPGSAMRRNREDLARSSAVAAIQTLRAVVEVDYQEWLSAVHVPTLLVAGRRDRSVPPCQAELAARRIPDAQLLLLDGVGHLPVDESPYILHQAMLRFLHQSKE